MRKSQNRSLTVSIFNNEYKVIVCWGDRKFTKRIGCDWQYPKEIETVLRDQNRGMCYFHSDCHPLIVLPKQPETPEEIGTLAHEAVHAIDDIFSKLDEDYRSSHEVFAHSVGAVVRTVLLIAKKVPNRK